MLVIVYNLMKIQISTVYIFLMTVKKLKPFEEILYVIIYINNIQFRQHLNFKRV